MCRYSLAVTICLVVATSREVSSPGMFRGQLVRSSTGPLDQPSKVRGVGPGKLCESACVAFADGRVPNVLGRSRDGHLATNGRTPTKSTSLRLAAPCHGDDGMAGHPQNAFGTKGTELCGALDAIEDGARHLGARQ
jgi:hypothetical protein